MYSDSQQFVFGMSSVTNVQWPPTAFAQGKFPPTPGAKPKGVGEGPKDGKLKFCTGAYFCHVDSLACK